MFIPTPIVPMNGTTTVINETIVYSDTVLNLKEVGDNLKLTSINNVSEFELENCLKKIFESNKNVVFNTIQYSKNNKKVYFYTNREINIEAWKESKFFKYEPITNKKEILKEIKKVLESDLCKDIDSVSLYNIFKVIKKEVDKLNNIKDEYKSIIKSSLREKYGREATCVIYDFDYENNLLRLAFKEYSWYNGYSEMQFSKDNNDLYIVKSENYLYGNDHFRELGDYLSKLYDELIKFKKMEKEFKYWIDANNSNFKIDISKYGVSIKVNQPNDRLKDIFCLKHSTYNSDYDYDCNSNEILSIMNGKEDELFKKIYVNIDKCPEWMQEELKNIRYNELIEEDRLEKEREERERLEELDRQLENRKKQKRLEFKRKIFPWIK